MSTEKTSRFLKQELPRWFLLIFTVLVAIVFFILEPAFFTGYNINNMFTTAAISGIMALGGMMAFGSGELNFGLGSIAAFSGTLLGLLTDRIGFGPALVVALLGAILIGVICSFFTFNLGLPSFVASLGIGKVFDGVSRFLCTNKSIYSDKWGPAFFWLGQGRIGVVNVCILLFAVIAVLMWFLTEKTPLGRHIFAVGDNMQACKQVGINVRRVKYISFILSSFFGGLAGVLYVSQIGYVPVLPGSSMLMYAIAASMLGATFLRPGRFNVPGVLLAAFLLSMIQNGIVNLGISSSFTYIVQGVILTISVSIIALVRKGGLPGVSFGN